MAGPTTEVLNDDIRVLRDEVHRVDLDVHVLGTQVQGIITAIKILGVFTLASLLSGVWWGASLTAKVDGLATRLDKVEVKVDDFGKRIDKLEARVDEFGKRIEQIDAKVEDLGMRVDDLGKRVDDLGKRIDARFDRLEGSIGRLIEASRPPVKP
jgi:uncharacterized protein YoxC